MRPRIGGGEDNQGRRWDSLLTPVLPVSAKKARFTALAVPVAFSSLGVVGSGVLGIERANSLTDAVFLQSSSETGGGIALLAVWKNVVRFGGAEEG